MDVTGYPIDSPRPGPQGRRAKEGPNLDINMSKQVMERPSQPVAPASVPTPNIRRRGFKGFYRDVVRELKHVTWPTKHETNRLTGVVLAVCALTMVVLTVLSIGFDTIFKIFFEGIK